MRHIVAYSVSELALDIETELSVIRDEFDYVNTMNDLRQVRQHTFSIARSLLRLETELVRIGLGKPT